VSYWSVDFPSEFPDRKRFSSYQSARGGSNGLMRHELWLPDTDDGPDPRGVLSCTTTVDKDGWSRYGGSLTDGYYYGLAADLMRVHEAGFAPVLNAIGISVDTSVKHLDYDNGYEYAIRTTFPPPEILAALGSAVLEKCGSDLRITALPPGQYSTDTFLSMFSNNEYPISSCYPTPSAEGEGDDFGSHDMLLHMPAVMAMAVTDTHPHLRGIVSMLEAKNTSTRQEKTDLEEFDDRWYTMVHIDSGINVSIFADLLEDDIDGIYYFRRTLGHLPSQEVDYCQQQVVNTLRDPLHNGFQALAGDLQ